MHPVTPTKAPAAEPRPLAPYRSARMPGDAPSADCARSRHLTCADHSARFAGACTCSCHSEGGGR